MNRRARFISLLLPLLPFTLAAPTSPEQSDDRLLHHALTPQDKTVAETAEQSSQTPIDQFVSSAATSSCQGAQYGYRDCTPCKQMIIASTHSYYDPWRDKYYWVSGYLGLKWKGERSQMFTTKAACDQSFCINCKGQHASCCPRPPPPPSAGCYKNEWATAGNEETRVQQSSPCMIPQFCRHYAIQEFKKKGETKKKYYGMEYPQGCPKGQAQCLYLTETQVQKWEKLADDTECRVPTEGGSLQGGSYRVYVRPV